MHSSNALCEEFTPICISTPVNRYISPIFVSTPGVNRRYTSSLSLHVHLTSLHLTRGRNVIYPLGLVMNNVPGTLFSLQSVRRRG